MKVIRHPSPKYWILFLLSVVAFFVVYLFAGGYCSMILPFNVTFFALALDLVDKQGKDGSSPSQKREVVV